MLKTRSTQNSHAYLQRLGLAVGNEVGGAQPDTQLTPGRTSSSGKLSGGGRLQVAEEDGSFVLEGAALHMEEEEKAVLKSMGKRLLIHPPAAMTGQR